MLLSMSGAQQKKEEIETISSELADVRRQMEKDGEQFTPPSSVDCVDGFVKFSKKESFSKGHTFLCLMKTLLFRYIYYRLSMNL